MQEHREMVLSGYELTLFLMLGSRTIIDDLHQRLAQLGYNDVRPAHGFAFQRIAPDGATGNELAEFLDITKQAASEMVDYLEKHGYLRQPIIVANGDTVPQKLRPTW
jgi:hypothetical protein